MVLDKLSLLQEFYVVVMGVNELVPVLEYLIDVLITLYPPHVLYKVCSSASMPHVASHALDA